MQSQDPILLNQFATGTMYMYKGWNEVSRAGELSIAYLQLPQPPTSAQITQDESF
jgi:hypothetical protein